MILPFANRLNAGIEDGSILPCDAKLAGFAIGGALNGIVTLVSARTAALSAETIAEEFALRLTDWTCG